RLEALERSRRKLLDFEPTWAAVPPDVALMRTTALEIKQQAEGAQRKERAEWQAADKLHATAEAALGEAARTRSLNESRLAEATQHLTPLLADGLSLDERQNRLAERRRERESGDDAVRAIDETLSKLPPDAPERADELRRQIDTLEAEIQVAREVYQQDEAAV